MLFRNRVVLFWAALIMFAVVALVFSGYSKGGVGGAQIQQEQHQNARVIRVVSHHPKHVIVKSIRFEPWSQPTVVQVHRIIEIESLGQDWIKSTLLRRIGCESEYRWYAGNGMYQGLGQFASSTFYRGMGTIGARSVEMRGSTSLVMHHITLDKFWSDGRITHALGKLVKTYIKRIYKGSIPSNPPLTHGWAQIRIMRQAIQGVSAVHESEWECR